MDMKEAAMAILDAVVWLPQELYVLDQSDRIHTESAFRNLPDTAEDDLDNNVLEVSEEIQ